MSDGQVLEEQLTFSVAAEQAASLPPSLPQTQPSLAGFTGYCSLTLAR